MAARALLLLAALCGARGAGPGPPPHAAPALSFDLPLYNVSIPENSAPRTYAVQSPAAPPLGVRLPAPAARVRFRIRHGDKDKFFKAEERVVGDFCFLQIRTRTGQADVLNRERRDSYRLEVRATAQLAGGAQLEADAVVAVEVTDENDLSPLFYPTEYDVTVPEDAALHSSVARVFAEDADLGINGEIYYSLAEPTDRFAVHVTSGVVTLTRVLSALESTRHVVTVLAHDRASLIARGDDAPAARATLVVRVARANLHAPEIAVRHLPLPMGNSTGDIYAIVAVTDRDAGEHGRIADLDIVDGDPDGHFRVRKSAQAGEYDVLVHALLDRGGAPRVYNLTLRATDAGTPPRSSYATLPVTLLNTDDDAPVFSREIYEASLSETAPPNTPVIRLKVTERDGGAARVYIEIVGGNEGGEFAVNPDTGVLYTAVRLDAEDKALYTLTVSAIDQGDAGTRKQSSAKVKIAVLDANDNDPVFEDGDMEVALAENGASGAEVARVLARDADSGENAYISYSIANLQPVPFDVDHFSGVVRTTRLLDYESMRREYVLQIRASDWGLPYRRQAEMRLTVRLEDVNDNRPQFERVDCVGYVPRGSAIGSEIVTLSAIDFDSGDVVSYRVIGGNEDNCFSLDSTTGVLILSCDLADVRAETRILNVTATDGTHFADAATLTLHLVSGAGRAEAGALECRDTGVARRLTETLAAAERSNAPVDFAEDFPPAPSRYGENLHYPEFVDFPVEVKVNESVALGTSLVHLHASDRDLGYNGLLVYAISGGDADSAFRIDPDTGELKVIGYLDRERESEYYLNVTAYDLGAPQRSASRLLPVTVLDVNDNPPRFERTLASFRVTENAINGTAIFRANATDPDGGAFGRVSYALLGGEGDFCVDRDGVVAVCAALDRERRALYELTVRATDGGGLSAEAVVRVAVDDVNDVAPRFALAAYSARVREDVPRGTVVAVLEAFDPDLGAGGRVSYSLPDQPPDDAAFTVDPTSGTLRTARRLDYEERQVYGVTVRATDGGAPALWAEATLIVEVGDVDENAHAPAFPAPAIAATVREDAAPPAPVLRVAAADADPPGRDSRLAYYILAGSGMPHFAVDDTGTLRTQTPLDRETAPHYWLTLCAQDHGLVPRHSCVHVYVEVEDVNDVAPWPERAEYIAVVPEHCPPGTPVARVTAVDGDAAPAPARLRYSIAAGNPDGLFAVDELTGAVTTTGRALDREAAAAHAIEVAVSDGELTGSARVRVLLADINDHAPAFTQSYYDVRVPGLGARGAVAGDEDDASSEGEADDADDADDEGEGARWELWDGDEAAAGAYAVTVLALDADAGDNGTVRYSGRARGPARRLLRVHARSGRVYVSPRLDLAPPRAHEIAVRACDGGRPARCAVARVRVRGAGRGGGGAPVLRAPAPLQAAELDAPGFLLALLQATDPDGDALYYDIVDGDPDGDWVVGREDGSVVLARRLLWERRAAYALNVSVTDGARTTHALVAVTVINDAHEGGVAFERERYAVDVSEAARPGEALVALRAAAAGGARLLYGVLAARAPRDLPLFRLHELTGVLELARPLDRETAATHELTVWARDQAPRASVAFARVTVRVHDADEHTPEWGRRLWEARVPRTAAPGALLAPLRASDRDAGAAPPRYSLTGDARGLFVVDDNGDVRLARALPATGPREYALTVRAAGPPPAARAATLPLHVIVVEPDDAPPRFVSDDIAVEVYENSAAGTVVATVEARSATAVRYWLAGGGGRFRLNPAHGALALAAPLDYETRDLYNLTVTAQNMGGGEATARVTVHVLDRNEFPPVLECAHYRGRVSESAAAGALVLDSAGAPLVLRTTDADGTAGPRTFTVHPPAAAALFRVDATTGALALAAPLDYEARAVHDFTVRVEDAGVPRLPAHSTAAVTVDVLDENDTPPAFERVSYEASVLLPTAAGVLVLALAARDPDGPAVKYDIADGDPRGAFTVDASGSLRVADAAAVPPAARLRVRASDGKFAATTRVDVRALEPDNSGLAFQKADYYGSVVENSTKPATVVVPAVLGAALDEHVEFSILNPAEGFEIGSTSGAVRTTGLAFDRELRDSYMLLVQARSAGRGAARGAGRVARARLHVTVSDVNDNCPVFVGLPYAAAVRAGAEPGPVLRVRAVDADANDNGEVRYEMKRGHGELFRVDRRSGEVALKQTLDAHNQLYTLVVAAFDGGTPACGSEATVSVRVWAGGAAPAWPTPHEARAVREDTPPGTPLGPPLRAVSPLSRQLIYTLQEGAADLFEIHFDTAPRGSGSCTLVARGALDYEAARSHALVVRATDAASGLAADLALTLDVLDANDCAPQFDRDEYRATVTEAAAVGTTLLTMRATDADSGENGEIVYSLASWGDEGAAAFAVDERSGAVRVAAALDRETRATHHLLVTATDAGRPPLATTVHLIVAVEDVNDNAPRMERAVISAVVSEEAARGTALARVVAVDEDADAELEYALVAEPAARRALALDPRTGVLALRDARAAAAAAVSARSLNVSVSDGAHATFARIKLSLAPVNRAPPHFPHLVHEARAVENQPPPLLLTTVKAYDDDVGEYGTVTYSIPSGVLRETFAVDPGSGALTTRVALDREQRAEWEVPVTASDGGGLLRHTAVRVRVADANDNAPEFPLREYRAAVRADRAPHAPFLTMTACDADAGEHARLTYSVVEGERADTAGLFAVDPHTGALAFARNASAFAGRTVQVWVRAVDGGGLAGEAAAAVSVLAAGKGAGGGPVGLRAPPPDVYVREDAAPGTLLAELGGARLRLAAPARTADRDLFALDAAGRLLLAAPLDREIAHEHVIGIIAESGDGEGGAAVMAVTRLHVLDVNEHAPAFHSRPYVVHLAENAPPGTSLVQLMADDPDAGANGEVRFALAADEGADEAPFAVDAQSGWVTTTAALDREARAEYRLALVAHDGGVPRRSSRGSLVVRLVDYNDCAPRFEREQYAAGVREDAAAGTVVARLAVRDEDAAGVPLQYFVAAGDTRARFQLRGGELLVARALDRELQPAYDLTVAATDGKFTAYAAVHVDVIDVNDNPPYCVRQRYSARVSEAAVAGAALLTLETRDADTPEHARLRYYLTGDGAEQFTIDQESGQVRVGGALDRETRARYTLRAHAADRERPDWGCSAELHIDLDDVNDNAPAFTAPLYSVTLPEDAPLGSLVAKVHATDEDLGENRLLRFSLAEGPNDVFEITADSGIITLRAPLDREAQAEHRLAVRVADAGRPSLTATAAVRLTVADVNDNPPVFERTSYTIAVAELTAPSAELLRIRATSQDTGVNAVVHYDLVAGEDREDFILDRTTGVLSVARPLDYERRREYLLTVQAVDGGSPPLSDHATVNVTVTDANDNAPVFSQPAYGARIREDAAVGARILQVIADDADSGANGRVTYSIVRGDRAGHFAVDPDTGYVSVAAPLDRETVAAYALEVRARDRGSPALEATVALTVEVTDANDNPPLFARTNYSAVVREDRPLGHTILEFVVDDADAPPNAAPYTFDFQSGNEKGAFRLDQDGRLRSATRFNHRIKDRYVLQVRVFDNGTPPLFSDAWVYIRVIEESQYPPVVTPLEVVINSYLDEFPGGVIGRVYASDRDADDTLSYGLAPAEGAPYPPADLFEIDAADGTLRAAPRLDVGDYRLNVTVDDGKFAGFAIVRVSVVLVSDELLAQAVVVRFREVTDADFVLSHRKGFVRAVREAADCEPGDVVLVSVMPAADGRERQARQVARDLDVAFAVRAPSAGGFLPADALRRRLHAHLERLEESARLVVEELLRAACGGCLHGACAERVALEAAAPRVVASDVFALVAPPHSLRGECVCAPGYGGERCDAAAAPCDCGGERCEPGCRVAAQVAYLQGDGYLSYALERGAVAGARVPDDELMVALRFRTRQPRGVLLAVEGRVDYGVLELVEGHVQFRLELGAGEARVRAGGPAADGEWHEVRLERRGAAVRLAVDRRAAHATAPPPAAVLDARADRVLVGAALARHAHALAPEQITYGFYGCLSDIKIGGSALPLEEGSTSADGRAQLMRRVRVRVGGTCPALPAPDACGAQPCLNGGTCRVTAGGGGYECACHERFSGRRCEVDADPCASAPCLHGGYCAAAGGAWRCACAAGLAGARCERGRWCGAGACLNGGACEEGEWGPSCRCRGYYGPRCQYDVDECLGEPCLNGATCLNEPGSFRCLCPPDKTGMNCGNPLYSDAVVAGEAAGGGRALRELWHWALAARWPLAAAGAALLLLLLLAALPPLLRRARRPPPAPLNSAIEKRPPRAKLSNLEAGRRGRPISCAEPPPLNNIDTLRSYGSAGDELELPPDYLRNLNVEPVDRKPWSEQMHLHTFVDNKIYNDLKACNTRRGRAGEPHLVGGYHWDCSDWCGGGALPGISEVAGSERPDTESPSPPSPPTSRPRALLPPDTDSAPDDLDALRFTDVSSCLLHEDRSPPPDVALDESALRARSLRDTDAHSLITMLEERHSLLGGSSRCSSLSAHLCEIEESDADDADECGDAPPPAPPVPATHTEV
ncbi:fat-like cadherin-related tumor suppressor homolog [Aricia agestis]|uniref:fat-like cadherin-related tumor suppressor homolog n=1 Tax=Aricia agestis TaxID=91739 RepID=UPI001C20BA90|nr:fat-like cadherin-related tumor suppressor homolog [Aricia agestis]